MPEATLAVDLRVGAAAIGRVPSAPSPRPAAGGAEPDAALVRAACRGERGAEEQLYRRHVEAVAAVAVRLLGRGGEAEDVVQDSFVTALERLPQLREPELFRAWVVRIAVSHVHRRFRRQRLLRLLGLQRGGPTTGLVAQALPSLPQDSRLELARIDAALHELPAGQRVCWVLRHVEGYELLEVARACDVSLATVKRWLARAEARVRAVAGGAP